MGALWLDFAAVDRRLKRMVLAALFDSPDRLKPQGMTHHVTSMLCEEVQEALFDRREGIFSAGTIP